MTPLRCYRCSLEPRRADEAERERLGQPIPRLEERDRREYEGLTIVNGTLTCLHHVRQDVQSAELSEEMRREENRRARGEDPPRRAP